MRRRTKWLLGSAVGVLAILVLLVAIGSQLPAPPPPGSGAQGAIKPAAAATVDAPATPSSPKPIEVTSDDLDQAFSDNEIAAKDRFGSKPLVVTGTIKKISEVTEVFHSNSASVELDGKDINSTVMAFLPQKQNAARFRPGDTAKVRCASVKSGWFGIDLYDCVPAPSQTS